MGYQLNNIVEYVTYIPLISGDSRYKRLNWQMLRDYEHYGEKWSMKSVKLTPEILSKCEGFSFHHNDAYNDFMYIMNINGDTPFVWGIYPKQLGSGVIIKSSKPIEYLHELQNIYEDISGNPLIVNL